MHQIVLSLLWVLRAVAALGGLFCIYKSPILLHTAHYREAFFLFLCLGLLSGLYTALDHIYVDKTRGWSKPITADRLRYMMSNANFKYGVILRSFRFDADIKLPNTFNPFAIMGLGFGMPIIDAQEWIIRSSPEDWRWLSWGGKLGAIRPVKIESGDEWFEELRPVIKLCDIVIIIPGSTDAICREFNLLLTERPQRTVIVWPPKSQNDGFYFEVKRSACFSGFIGSIPDDGCLLLPFRHPDGEHVAFATYPLNSKTLRRILETRNNTTKN